MELYKELDNVTECPICNDVFTDPRILPCKHTFCFECLLNCLNYGKNRKPGDRLPCPVCRKKFTIPQDGLSGIQKNVDMKKLLRGIHVRKLSAGKARHILCDVCSGDEGRPSEATSAAKLASVHCFHCQQNYCCQCLQRHTTVTAASSHVTIEIGKQQRLQMKEIAVKLPTSCEIHKDEETEVLCLKCQLAICMICFTRSHTRKTHDCSVVEDVSVNFRKQMKNDKDKISELLEMTGTVLSRIEKENTDSVKRLADVKNEINTAADKMIAAIQRDRKKLLSELKSIKLQRVKQLEAARTGVEQHRKALESFKRDSETLSSGTVCDVMKSANSLHDRADKLMLFDFISYVDSSLPPINVKFTSSSVLESNVENIVGSITKEGSFCTSQVFIIFWHFKNSKLRSV